MEINLLECSSITYKSVALMNAYLLVTWMVVVLATDPMDAAADGLHHFLCNPFWCSSDVIHPQLIGADRM